MRTAMKACGNMRQRRLSRLERHSTRGTAVTDRIIRLLRSEFCDGRWWDYPFLTEKRPKTVFRISEISRSWEFILIFFKKWNFPYYRIYKFIFYSCVPEIWRYCFSAKTPSSPGLDKRSHWMAEHTALKGFRYSKILILIPFKLLINRSRSVGMLPPPLFILGIPECHQQHL